MESIQGKAQVEQLLLDVLQALARAGLDSTLRMVDARILSRPSEELFDTGPARDGRWECRFKPMVELLLRDILTTASRPDLSSDARHGDIARVLVLAGF